MMGVQGLYDDGWMLIAVPMRPPWVVIGAATASAHKFGLYDVRHDWTQSTDLAAHNLRKVTELTEREGLPGGCRSGSPAPSAS